jgi:hypothetical protein
MRTLRLILVAHLIIAFSLVLGCSADPERAGTAPVDPKLEGLPAAKKQGVQRPVAE